VLCLAFRLKLLDAASEFVLRLFVRPRWFLWNEIFALLNTAMRSPVSLLNGGGRADIGSVESFCLHDFVSFWLP